MGVKDFNIDVLKADAVERAARFFNYNPTGADDLALRKNMASGAWTIALATAEGADIGGFYLNHAPKYSLYQRLKLPELQDLRVLPAYRRQGIAKALIAKGEDLARASGAPGLGLSVGLYDDYGPAQILYFNLGYQPDGRGITYDREPVIPGEARKVDDDLCLMLLKLF